MLDGPAPPSLATDPIAAHAALAVRAGVFAQAHGPAGATFAQDYTQEAARLHVLLPDILGRIRILDANGAEIEVAERVMQQLEQRYSLPRPVVEHTLFRNLRCFINDVAKQPNRSFTPEDLDTEIGCVWPHMVPIKVPPPLADDHVRRPTLVASLADPWMGAAVEVAGYPAPVKPGWPRHADQYGLCARGGVQRQGRSVRALSAHQECRPSRKSVPFQFVDIRCCFGIRVTLLSAAACRKTTRPHGGGRTNSHY